MIHHSITAGWTCEQYPAMPPNRRIEPVTHLRALRHGPTMPPTRTGTSSYSSWALTPQTLAALRRYMAEHTRELAPALAFDRTLTVDTGGRGI
jgi:hypothetical protein